MCKNPIRVLQQSRNLFVFLQTSMLTLRLVGEDSDILESVIDALFLATQNYHNKDQSRTIADMNATGVYILPECAEGKLCPHAHFLGTFILTSVGIQILFFHWSGRGKP